MVGNSDDLELEKLRERIMNENEALNKLLRNLQSIDSETRKKKNPLQKENKELTNNKNKQV